MSGNLTISKINNSDVSGGVATLDANGCVPLSQTNSAILGAVLWKGLYDPSTNTPPLQSGVGRTGDMYAVSVASNGIRNIDGITEFNKNDILLYNGTIWQIIRDNNGDVISVNSKKGAVVITKSDVGLPNVDNTADSQKSVLSATKLSTPRKINGVNFDGTTDITIAAGSGVQADYKQEDFSKPDYILNRLLPATDIGLLRQNGVASLGTNYSAARTDHIHPSDSAKQDKPNGLGTNSCGDNDHYYGEVYTNNVYGSGTSSLRLASMNGQALEIDTSPNPSGVTGNINIGSDGATERNIRIGILNGNSSTSIQGGANGVTCGSVRAYAKVKPREFTVSVEPVDNAPSTLEVKANIKATSLTGGMTVDCRDGLEVKSALGALIVPEHTQGNIPNDTKFGIYRTGKGLYTTMNGAPFRITKPQPVYLFAQSAVNVNPTENMVLKFPTILFQRGGVTYNANRDEFTLPYGSYKITSQVVIVDNGGGISNVIQKDGVDVGIWGNASDVSGSRGTSSPAIAIISVDDTAVIKVVVKEDATTSTDFRGCYILIEQLDMTDASF